MAGCSDYYRGLQGLDKMKEELQAQKIQRAHRTSQGIAMRSDMDKVQSP
jgi:hypothetical protein